MELASKQEVGLASRYERIQLRLHLLTCGFCASFQRFQRTLRRFASMAQPDVQLTEAALQEMDARFRELRS